MDTYDKDNLFTNDDFVLTSRIEENGERKFIGGGYKIESFLLEKDISPMNILNSDQEHTGGKVSGGKVSGGKVSSPFENLAVPAGLFFINQKTQKQMYDTNVYKHHETIQDDIMDTLFGLANNDNKKRKATRKRNDKINTKKTRRRTLFKI
jgi:hypothetical protein